MAMGRKIMSGSRIMLLWLTLFIAFAGWVCMLAAIAALQNDCGGAVPHPAIIGYAGFLAPNVSCSKFYRFSWWTTFYQLFTVALTFILLAAGKTHSFRAGLIGLLAPITVLLMENANTFLYANDIAGDNPAASSAFKARIRTYLSGCIISAVGNFALIMAVGKHDETAYGTGDEAHRAKAAGPGEPGTQGAVGSATV